MVSKAIYLPEQRKEWQAWALKEAGNIEPLCSLTRAAIDPDN